MSERDAMRDAAPTGILATAPVFDTVSDAPKRIRRFETSARNGKSVAVGVPTGPMGSAASPFIVDDAIVGLAQPLTETLNQLSRGPRRACDVIEELGRREDFYLHLAGSSCRRTAGAVFHNAYLTSIYVS